MPVRVHSFNISVVQARNADWALNYVSKALRSTSNHRLCADPDEHPLYGLQAAQLQCPEISVVWPAC